MQVFVWNCLCFKSAMILNSVMRKNICQTTWTSNHSVCKISHYASEMYALILMSLKNRYLRQIDYCVIWVYVQIRFVLWLILSRTDQCAYLVVEPSYYTYLISRLRWNRQSTKLMFALNRHAQQLNCCPNRFFFLVERINKQQTISKAKLTFASNKLMHRTFLCDK